MDSQKVIEKIDNGERTIAIAFYKGSGRLFDKIIRWWTRSKYSHVELVLSKNVWVSSSPRDGGVRIKSIFPKYHHWDFVVIDDIPVCKGCAIDVLALYTGLGYDWLGAILGAGLGIPLHQRGFFCTEIAVLGLQVLRLPIEYDFYTPQELFDLLTCCWDVEVFET